MTPFTNRLMDLPRYAVNGASAIHPGFDRIQMLQDGMGHPEKEFSVALVAGTNGKGSTASIMAACLTSHGIRTGLHTSPHLLHVSERMRVDGKAPSNEWLEAQCERFEGLFVACQASFFEATLALSLFWFADQNVTHAVVEVGLGGRLDATNVLEAEVSVITGVALDHTDILGDTIGKIATEKAGIIKKGKPVILGPLSEEARLAIEEVAQRQQAPVFWAEKLVTITSMDRGLVRIVSGNRCLEDVSPELRGLHQWSNTAVALSALSLWVPEISYPALRSGLEHVSALAGLRARTEIVRTSPLVMVDVGHNPDALVSALASFGSIANPSKACIVLGLLSDKDAIEVGRLIAKTGLQVFTVPVHGERGRTETALLDVMKTAGVSQVRSFSSVPKALVSALELNLDCLVIGSHFVAAEALTFFATSATQ